MDLSHKLLLMTAYNALVDAELHDGASIIDNNIGVFVGAGGMVGEVHSPSPENKIPSVFDATSNTLSVAAGRVSFALGLQGPCSSTDTACSSSLVALHAAWRSLQHNDCSAAVVIGVNILHPGLSAAFSIAGITNALRLVRPKVLRLFKSPTICPIPD